MVRLTIAGEDLCRFACSKPVESFSWLHQELFPSLCVNRGVGAPPWHPDGVVKCMWDQDTTPPKQ
jgi:hypothetical protein